MSRIDIKTVLKKSKSKKDDATIYLRIKLLWGNEADMLDYSTRETIKCNQFKGGNEPVKAATSNIELQRINKRIRDYINTIYDLFEDYKANSNILSKGQFHALINQKLFNIKSDAFDYNLYLSDLFPRYVRLKGNKLGENRKTRYTFIQDQIKSFCKTAYGVEKFDVKRLDKEFHEEFRNYLTTQYDYCDNTLVGYLKVLDAAVRSAYEDGKIERYPFEGIRYTYTEGDIKYLTKDELDRIKNKFFDDERLQLVADVFSFAAHTGISHCDLYTLGKEDLFWENNRWVIKKKRSKSKVKFTAPLDKTAIAILNKYKNNLVCVNNNKLLPVLYINEYNECLKRIADKCSIAMNLTSHIARHTFATTNWINKGLTIESLKSVLGHKRISTTERYAKITDVRVHSEANKITDYNYDQGCLYSENKMNNHN